MTIHVETSLENFEAWAGGKDTLNTLSHDDIETLEAHLEELYPDGMTDTELNDFLWFETATIAELCGYRNEDAMRAQDHDSWEEHYREILNDNFEADEEIEDWITYESEEGMSDEDVLDSFRSFLDELEENED